MAIEWSEELMAALQELIDRQLAVSSAAGIAMRCAACSSVASVR